MKSKILEVEHLSVTFPTYQGNVQAVRDVSWYLNRGEAIAIVGESGCGKSVSIQTIMGLTERTAAEITGEVHFDGDDLMQKTDREMRAIQGDRISMIFQDPFTYLNPTKKVGKQITDVYRKHHKVSEKVAKEKALEILRLVSLPDPKETMKRYPHQLSGGMRQRIMIAIALICDPEILFADEPTTALDVTVQAQIVDLLCALQEKTDTSIVLITHDMGVVAKMANRIYIMYAGKIMEHGYVDAIFYHAKHPYTKALLNAVPRPDQKTAGELPYIPGSPVDLIAPPEGCPFAARCQYAMRICTRRMPDYQSFAEPEHYAACWLNHPAYNKATQEGGTVDGA